VTPSLGSLGYVDAHEVTKARIDRELVKGLKAFFVRRLAQQSVLPLHRPISPPLAGICASGASDW
jgi:hypothetical protein